MTTSMKLAADGCVAIFEPADGGRLVSFQVGDRELLVAHGKDVFHFGSFVIAPWVGRLRDARLNFGGVQRQFAANAGPHALHGLVTDRPWQVSGDGELSIELGEPWPWPCRIVQRAELGKGRATFRIEVHAREAMPAAVGWHPWFVRRLAGTPASAALELDAQPRRMWANDAAGLPTGELTAAAPRPWDYCFRDLPAAPVVRWPGELELTVGSDCEDWVIYDMEEAGICVEPWTGPPNSLNMPTPRIVTPDAPLTASMTWTWRQPARRAGAPVAAVSDSQRLRRTRSIGRPEGRPSANGLWTAADAISDRIYSGAPANFAFRAATTLGGAKGEASPPIEAIWRTKVAVIGLTGEEAGRKTVRSSGAIAPFMPAICIS
jgi:aldose 1-epimerase